MRKFLAFAVIFTAVVVLINFSSCKNSDTKSESKESTQEDTASARLIYSITLPVASTVIAKEILQNIPVR